MAEILMFTVFYMACLSRDGETLPRVPDHCSSLRAALHLHLARICMGHPLTAWCAKPCSSPLLASVCGTRCNSSQTSRAKAQASWQLNSPNHKLALCNDGATGLDSHFIYTSIAPAELHGLSRRCI